MKVNIKESLKRVFLTILLIVMFCMTSQNSYAADGYFEKKDAETNQIEEKYFNKTNPYSGTFSLLLSDLMSPQNWNMLCSENGQHLSSALNKQSLYKDFNVQNPVMSIDEFKRLVESQTGETFTYHGKYYSDGDNAYKVTKTKTNSTPKLAYILNRMEENVNSLKEYFKEITKIVQQIDRSKETELWKKAQKGRGGCRAAGARCRQHDGGRIGKCCAVYEIS